MKNLLYLLFVLPLFLHSQIDLTYQKPAKEILELVETPLPPVLSNLNSGASKGLLLYRESFKSIEELSEQEMRLAGLRINPNSFISSRQRYYFKIKVLDLQEGKEMSISGLPPNAKLSNFLNSPDEQKISFTNTTSHGVELWILDLSTAEAHKLTDANLNANMGNPAVWMKNSKQLIVKIRSRDSDELIDKQTAIPTGPTVSVNAGQKAQNRTYQDLLKDKADEHNFEVLTSSYLYKINVNGNKERWKEEDMYGTISISPDGSFILLSTIDRPFSYLVPYRRFPTSTDVYDQSGTLVNHVHAQSLLEDLPKGRMSAPKGMRNIQWRPDRASALYWVEAQDNGDPSLDVPYRDAVFERAIPFKNEKRKVLQTINRFSNITWGSETIAVATDRWWKNRNTKTYVFNPSEYSDDIPVIFDRNYQDRYADPGDFITARNEFGKSILVIREASLFLKGDGYSDEGIHAFIDELDIHKKEASRLWQAEKNQQLERITKVIDIDKGKVLTRIESPNDYPNYYMRHIHEEQNLRQITQFKNPFGSLSGIHKEVVKYQREDGVDLSGTLYLPAGYDPSSGEKLPMLLWAYPREYKDVNSASQISASPYQFTFPSYGSAIFWVTRGYAVLDRASFPIIGLDEGEPNDEFVEQLVANGKAAIDAIDQLGYIDRSRVGVGGHSYGAFMTANLLSHSDLFAGGIARSGAYNRTLTPFGFQSEDRTYWDAPHIYYEMSPFMHAHKMKTPLLLIHGEADNNSGTYPIQSQRYFHALKGLGATVRLVMLPKESHGYAAKESIYHMLWEQDQWLEKYVKNRHKDTASRPRPK